MSSPYLVTIPVPETPPQDTARLPHAPGRPQVSADGLVAFARIDLAPDLDFNETSALGTEFIRVIPDVPGLQVELGGEALSEFEPPQSEFIGLAFAIVVLIVAFGSVMAMGLPLAVAVAGVGVGIALTVILSNVLSIPEFATTIGAMVGIGVGIDYALFIVTRYRDGLAEDGAVEASALAAFDTAGRAVIFAGLTVVVSLLGLLLMGLPFIAGLAVAAAITVATTMIASVTLLPALIGFVRDRIETTQWRGLVAAACIAVALLGVGLGFRPLLLGAPLAVIVFLAGFVAPPLRAVVPRRPRTPLQADGCLPLEPHGAGASVDRTHRRCGAAARDGVARAVAAARVRRRRQLPRGNHDAPRLRPPGRWLRPRLQRPAARDRRTARRAGSGRRRVARRRARGRRGRRLRERPAPQRPRGSRERVGVHGAGVSGDLAAGPGDRGPRQPAANRRDPRGRGRERPGGERHRHRRVGRGLHGLPCRAHARLLRGRARALVRPADGRVPLGARAAQGGGDEPAVDRRRLRRRRHGVPARAGSAPSSASTRARSSRSSR